MTLLEFRKKMNGIFLPGIVAGVFMVGLISTTIAAITATSFSTLGATKTASQAQQFGQAEAEYIKIMGYNNYASLVHGRQSMEELVGEDGAKYQSKVEVADTSTNGEGREVKVMKINVYKGNEINSRYSEEIPLVSGLDYSEKFDAINNLIDAITNRVSVLETNLADLSTRMTNAEKNINAINADLDRLEELINDNADAIAANRASIDKNASDIKTINKQIIQVKSDISDLKTDLSSLRAALNQEIANRKSEDSALQSKINAVKADVASLQTSVATITGRLNGKEFVKNYSKQNNISLNYENGEMVAYVDGNKVPLSSQGGSSGGNPDYSNAETISPNIDYTLKKDSYIYVYMYEVPTAYSQTHIIIDGNDFILGKSAGNYTFQNIKTSLWKVKKGSTIKVVGSAEIKILPCI